MAQPLMIQGLEISMAHNAGKAALKFRRRTRIFMLLKMFPTEICNKYYFLQKVQTPRGLPLFTLPRVMKMAKPNTLCCTCNMVGAKMRLHGVSRVALT